MAGAGGRGGGKSQGWRHNNITLILCEFSIYLDTLTLFSSEYCVFSCGQDKSDNFNAAVSEWII